MSETAPWPLQERLARAEASTEADSDGSLRSSMLAEKQARQVVFFYDVQNVLLHIAMNVNRRMRPFYRQENATDSETWVCLAQNRHITCSAVKDAKNFVTTA
ncbi:MAG: hypothetical protein VX005_07960 [Pseudomonadota bacterium]|nr:hypothetical protein [Pseudomonadota bacterium]